MNVLFRLFLHIVFIFVCLNVLAQNEYEDDEDVFVSFKSKKSFEGKRKFNIHLRAGFSMSTVFGKDVNITKDSLKAIKKRYNLDSYQIEANISPYGAVDFSYNFTSKLSLVLGFKYNNLGWREVAKYENTDHYYLFYSRYNFHYISTGLSIHGHLGKHFSMYGGGNVSYLFKNDIFIREYEIYRGNTLTDTKQTEEFSTLTNINAKELLSQFFIGSHFGFDRIRFNVNLTYTPNFIDKFVGYNNLAVEAGILFKIFNDYDKL